MTQNKNNYEENTIKDTLDLSIKTENLSEQIKDVVDVIGMDCTVKLIREFGGEALYFPKLDSIARHSRNIAIRKAFTGNNVRELSRKYRLSMRHIRHLLKRGNTLNK